MKTKLLFVIFLVSLSTWAQTPIASYYGTDGVEFTIVTSSPDIDQSASGANVNWNFSNFTAVGQSTDHDLTPSPAEVSQFPGTTAVVQTLSQVGILSNELRTYSKAPANALSITGISNGGLLLNYSTNNALIGTFPLTYGYNNVDNVAGTYDNGSYSGTFTGTITSSVDAYGTLTVDGTGVNAYSGPATRLKTVQTLNLNYSIFNNVGTITATTYGYYGTGLTAGIPRFRTTTTAVSVPLLSIDDTASQMEVFFTSALQTNSFDATAAIFIAPNPADDKLFLQTNGVSLQSVRISDLTGKTVMLVNGNVDNVDVSRLQGGIYLAIVTTSDGLFVKKFVKR